jgi:hypothetical protein
MPPSYAGLVLLSQRCQNGATLLGASIPLLINTAAAIGADRAALLNSQGAYQASRGAIPGLMEALKAARKAAALFCGQARSVLEFYLGTQHTDAWRPTGFINNLAVPRNEAGLVALLSALRTYFTANPTRENADLQVTAGRAQTLLDNLNTARQNFDAQVSACTAQQQEREAKVTAMRKRISGLCKELVQRLTPLDARWRDFGLNMPGAPSVPAVPKNVVVTPTLPGQLQVTCDPSANATHYRFFYQRPIIDPEPVDAGTASDPLFILTGLMPGQSYLVFVSAVNEGAESELSSAVSAVPQAAAAA